MISKQWHVFLVATVVGLGGAGENNDPTAQSIDLWAKQDTNHGTSGLPASYHQCVEEWLDDKGQGECCSYVIQFISGPWQ